MRTLAFFRSRPPRCCRPAPQHRASRASPTADHRLRPVPPRRDRSADAGRDLHGRQRLRPIHGSACAHTWATSSPYLLIERTDASKESSTSTREGLEGRHRLADFRRPSPTLNGNAILNNEIATSNSFDGKADSSQSNRLDGNITVTVAERLPNGNLLVRGEKRITINQGEEYIRLQGIMRPVDIGPRQHRRVDAGRGRARSPTAARGTSRMRTSRAG